MIADPDTFQSSGEGIGDIEPPPGGDLRVAPSGVRLSQSVDPSDEVSKGRSSSRYGGSFMWA